MSLAKKIVIVGGGITGLSAAFYLKREMEEKQIPYELTVIEATDRLGGKIRTLHKEGYTIERGADSFLGRKLPAIRLAEALDLSDQLVRNSTGQAYIHLHNQLHKMPQGAYMGVPTQLAPLLHTDLYSVKGKLRAGLDYVLPKGKAVPDQSLGGFLRRRLGDELVENVMEPLLSGIYSADVDKMSLMATFPNFYELEQEHRSLIKGLRKTLPQQNRSTGKKTGQFFAYQGGFESMIDALANELGEEQIIRNQAVKKIEKSTNKYDVHLQNGDVYDADAVIMTTPHRTFPKLFESFDLFDPLKEIPVSSAANIAFAFDESALEDPLDGTGFVVSRNSDFRITACTWVHKKWPHTTPKGKILLRAFVGKPNDQEVVDLPDEELTALVRHDLQRIMKIVGEPEFTVITRWKEQMPQYTVGHQDRIARVRGQMEKQLPGIFLAGSSFGGVGVPDCIGQSEELVADVLDYFKENEPVASDAKSYSNPQS
ncbi:MAG TPA: protoporphyrinogen oxidase [Virgibacillus sp.]|nr:protoporphyrinogen oxidase [Virgibacillus sp.]